MVVEFRAAEAESFRFLGVHCDLEIFGLTQTST